MKDLLQWLSGMHFQFTPSRSVRKDHNMCNAFCEFTHEVPSTLYESIQSLSKQQRLLLNEALKPVHKITITDITRCSLELFGAILSRPGKNAIHSSEFAVFSTQFDNDVVV